MWAHIHPSTLFDLDDFYGQMSEAICRHFISIYPYCKSNQIKSNQIKSNQIKSNQIIFYICISPTVAWWFKYWHGSSSRGRRNCAYAGGSRALAVRTFIDSNNKRQLMEFRENLSRWGSHFDRLTCGIGKLSSIAAW
jgi:hypothetical protein